jgi:hypothetical protein
MMNVDKMPGRPILIAPILIGDSDCRRRQGWKHCMAMAVMEAMTLNSILGSLMREREVHPC